MSETQSFLRKVAGFDDLQRELTEHKTAVLARFDELDRQVKRVGDSVAYANQQLLELREKLENVEILMKRLEPKETKEHRARKEHNFNEVEEKILEVVRKGSQVSASEASLLSGLSRTRASEILNELARKSIIRKEKKGKISFFILNSDVSERASGGPKETK
ncbi:MAG: hypothetical protein V1820_05610 [archaeon]